MTSLDGTALLKTHIPVVETKSQGSAVPNSVLQPLLFCDFELYTKMAMLDYGVQSIKRAVTKQ